MKIYCKTLLNTAKVLLFFIFACSTAKAQYIISGKVLAQDTGTALEGASIKSTQSKKGTFSNESGNFTLSVPDLEGDIEISYAGYETLKLALNGQTKFEIVLKLKDYELDDIVVVGFGTQSRYRVSSSISSVKEQVYEQIPETNFQTALGGRIPGLTVTQTNGLPGSAVAMRIRGPSSINADNQPLVVIDGMIVNGVRGAVLGGGGYSNPLVGLNPADIQSVEVLKDAAASSIYGSQGANGVIIVTTKEGSFNADPQVNIGFHIGISEPTNLYEVLDGEEFARLWNQAAENSGETLRYTEGIQPLTDWQDLVTRRGLLINTNASLKGGNKSSKYFVSASFQDEESYYLAKGLKRYTVRAKLDQMITDELMFGISITPSRTENQRVFEFAFDAPMNAPSWQPNAEAFDSLGTPICVMDEFGFETCGSPLIDLLENEILQTTTQVLLSSHLSYSPIPDLTIRTELSAESSQIEEFARSSSKTSSGSQVNGIAAGLNEQLFSYNWTNTIKYEPNLAFNHDLDLTLGANFIENKRSWTSAQGINFPNDDLDFLVSASVPIQTQTNRRHSTFGGYFLRANYAFNGRYVLSISSRIDGSSRFGRNNRYGHFPAISAGWIIKGNNNSAGSLNFLKLRGSLGVSGNAGIFDFATRDAISYSYAYGENPASLLIQYENDDLSWEKNQQWDIGLDFSLFNNRLKGSLGYYQKDTKDLLLEVPIPSTSGLSSILDNIGSMRNQGLEFDLAADLFKGNFNWSLTLNGSSLKNEILALGDNDNDGQDEDIIMRNQIFRVGESAAAWYLLEYAGVDPSNGDALFLDRNGMRIPNPGGDDRKIAGRALPKLSGGFSTHFSYKEISFDALFQYALGHHIYRMEAEFIEDNFRGVFINQRRSQLNAWTPTNRMTDIPQLRFQENNGAQASTRFLDPGDFLRLKNVQLSYHIPNAFKGAKDISIFISGQNLLTFTRFTGLDPEVVGFSPNSPAIGFSAFSSPQARKLVAGFNLNL